MNHSPKEMMFLREIPTPKGAIGPMGEWVSRCRCGKTFTDYDSKKARRLLEDHIGVDRKRHTKLKQESLDGIDWDELDD